MAQRTTDKTQDSMYDTEHWLAWAMAAVAIVLGLIGLLWGFGILSTDVSGVGITDDAGAADTGHWWYAAVWLLAGLSAAFLSNALHQNDHHWLRDPDALEDKHEGLWKGEHAAAWIMALLTIALAVVGVLVGLDVLNLGTDAQEGVLWLLASNGTAILTNTLHQVRHHQLASEENNLVRMVERRVGNTTTSTRPTTERERGNLG